MMEQAVDVMMTSEVGDDRAGRRHEQDHIRVLWRETMHHMKCYDGHLEVDSVSDRKS